MNIGTEIKKVLITAFSAFFILNAGFKVYAAENIAAGYDRSFAVDTNGEFLACGDNSWGELGDEANRNPENVHWEPAKLVSGSVASGMHYSLKTMTGGGTLWACGNNQYGQLGDGTTVSKRKWEQVGSGFCQVACGNNHSLALKEDGTLWACGDNNRGQLGDGTTINKSSWEQVGSGFYQISAGFDYSLAIKIDGTLWACGNNDFGQLGDGTTGDKITWQQVGSKFCQISCGQCHSLAIKTDGTLWAAGNNNCGQLGDGTTINKSSWEQVGSGFWEIASGGSHSLALKENGTLWACGRNNEGQLGDGTAINKSSWEQVGLGSDFCQIASGSNHSMALKLNGNLLVCGDNEVGQLGDGTEVNKVTWEDVLRVSTDNTVLNLTVDTMSPTNKSVTITATVSIMATVSNPRSVLARITKPDGTVVDLFKSTSTTYTVTSNGTYTFEVDCGITRSVTINNIDKEPPAAPVINVKGNQLTIAAGKDDGSGVKETDYQLNNGEWTRYTAPVTLPDGNYTINAKTIDNADNTSVIATTNVTIVTKAVGISLNKITSNLIVGQADNLTAVVTPDNAANKTVKWTSSDSSIASVDENGKVTALKAGTVKITASTTDGSNLTASCDVTVKAANRIDLSKSTDNLTVGQTDKLKAVVTSDNENKTVKWMSSDPSVVTVDEDGTITAVKAGNAVIEAVAQDGSNMVASCAVKVEDATKKLILNMTNSTIRQYKLSETEFNDFLTWYSNMVQEGTGTPYYIFNVPANGSIPASKEYVFYKNIESFKEEDL